MLIRLLLLALVVSSCGTKSIIDADDYQKDLEKHRHHYKAEFTKSSDSPLAKEDLQHMRFFAADPTYRCDCKVKVIQDPEPFEIDTYSGMKKPYVAYATVVCPKDGDIIELTLYRSLRLVSMPPYRDYLFLPFMDATNGDTTYGGGRYIDLKTTDITDTGTITIDFNKCYNPYCAYSDGYNCPVPPPENHLEMAITAGEKMYVGTKKKRKQS